MLKKKGQLNLPAHEFCAFWQVRKINQSLVMECGIHDNIPNSFYERHNNLGIHDIIKNIFIQNGGFFTDEFKFFIVDNTLARDEFLNHSCVTQCRRVVLYGALFVDFLGSFEKFEKPHAGDTDVSRENKLYQYHLNAYNFQMKRMYKWLWNSPLIWPAPGQTEPTAEHPVCTIHPSYHFQIGMDKEIEKVYGSSNLTVELDINTMHITLNKNNPLNELDEIDMHYQWDAVNEDNAFTLEKTRRPEAPCVVSSNADNMVFSI